MKLGGLDIASVTGLSIMESTSREITTSTFRAGGKKRFLDVDSKQLDAERMGEAGRTFEDHLTAWLIDNGIEHVGIEEPLNPNLFNRKKRTAKDADAVWASNSNQFEENEMGASLATFFKIHGLEFVACTVCRRLNIPVLFVNQSTWRKAFLGTGRPPGGSAGAKKAARTACQRLGIECTSDDAAESAGIVTWLYNRLFPYGVRANDLFKSAG